MTARVSLLPLLIGKVHIDVNLFQNMGRAHMFFSLPLFSHKEQLDHMEFNFSQFELKDVFALFLSAIDFKTDPSMEFIYPLVANSEMGGNLNGTVDFRDERGKIDLHLENGYFMPNNSSLNISKQNFAIAKFNAVWDEDAITVVKNNNKIESQNLSLITSGFIKRRSKKMKTEKLNMDLKLRVSGEIEKNFGFLLPQVLNCPATSLAAGEMNVRLAGEPHHLICQ